jgi:hypothetical protein
LQREQILLAMSANVRTVRNFLLCAFATVGLCLAQENGSHLKEEMSTKTEGSIETPVTINLPLLKSQGSRYNPDAVSDDWYVAAIAADQLPEWEIQLPDRLTIAIIDSGIDPSHPAFRDNLWKNRGGYYDSLTPTEKTGWDFVNHNASPIDHLSSSHGTHTAGLASARCLAKWLPAFSPTKLNNLELLILKVADTNDDVVDVGGAIEAAVRKGARIVSGSWTLSSDSGVERNIRDNEHNLLFVVAAGNGGPGNLGFEIDEDHPSFPASLNLPNVISVGATDPEDKVAYFSNYGHSGVQIFAPGVLIRSTVRADTVRGDPYDRLSGTSQAAPLVALTAALIWEKLNNLLVQDVKARIIDTSDFVGDTLEKGCGIEVPNRKCGGRLNLAKAITIDHDVMQIKKRSSPLRIGTINNKKITFAVGVDFCEDEHAIIKQYDVREEHVTRLTFHALRDQRSLLYTKRKVLVGAACDEKIDFTTTTGEVLHERVNNLSDLVWALYYPNN